MGPKSITYKKPVLCYSQPLLLPELPIHTLAKEKLALSGESLIFMPRKMYQNHPLWSPRQLFLTELCLQLSCVGEPAAGRMFSVASVTPGSALYQENLVRSAVGTSVRASRSLFSQPSRGSRSMQSSGAYRGFETNYSGCE